MFSMQKFLFLLLSLVLLGPLGIDLYLPAIPAIASGLNSSEEVIQSSISLFILVMGLGQLIAGPLVDRFGRRPMADGHHRCGGVSGRCSHCCHFGDIADVYAFTGGPGTGGLLYVSSHFQRRA